MSSEMIYSMQLFQVITDVEAFSLPFIKGLDTFHNGYSLLTFLSFIL